MILCLLFAFVVISITTTLFARNLYLSVIYIRLLSIILITIGYITLISKFSSYQFVSNYDYGLYLKFQKIRIHPDLINNIITACHTLYMTSSVLFLKIHYRINWKYVLLASIPLIYFMIINTSEMSIIIALKLITQSSQYSALIANLLINKATLVIMIAYSILPIVCIFVSMFKTRNILLKNCYLSYFVCIVICELIYQYVFLFGTFKNVAPHKLVFYGYPTGLTFDKSVILASIIFAISTVIICSIIIIFQPFKIKRLNTYNIRSKEFQQYQKDHYYTTVHSIKNTLLSLYKYIEVSEKYIDNEKARIPLEYAKKQIDEQLETYVDTIKILKKNYIVFSTIDITALLTNVIAGIPFPEDIILKTNFEADKPIYIQCDKVNIENCITNLINNSINSLKVSEKETKEITISIFEEYDYVMIDVTDNGNGIPKKMQKCVFNLFFSTHANKYGSGIGLYYVKQILNMHKGAVWFESTPSHTTFTISLPMVHNKNSKLNNKKIFKKG